MPSKFPIPWPDEILDKLNNKKLFSVLNFKNGYYHIAIRLEDRHKTVFLLLWYKFQFIRMAQVYSGARLHLQKVSIILLLGDFIAFCDGFFDDVIIFSEIIEQQLIHLEKAWYVY